jgi:glycosyltransferase involved in cell wall biosynthesis
MRILMFGWEFPPHVSGGLGTACFGITKALTGLGNEIVFIIPRIKGQRDPSHVELVSASEVPVPVHSLTGHDVLNGLDVRIIHSLLSPYLTENQYSALLERHDIAFPTAERDRKEEKRYRLFEISDHYGPNLIAEVLRYGKVAGIIAEKHTFDVIHAHDWMTIFAGLHARKISGKPLVLHIHALEFDRSGDHINQQIYDIERHGISLADHIIAVSHYTKNMIVSRYGANPDKITVVHNAVSRAEAGEVYHVRKKEGKKVVLFLGRVTFQKGPDYFVEAAARVIEEIPHVTFVMAGAGDMMPRMIKRVAQLRMGKNFHFTGFLQGQEVEQIFTMSDLYVMPSVSEPFGISPLEAMVYDVPVIISRQSGVSEILHHALKVDFWDVKEMANKIIAVLKHPTLSAEIVERSREEVRTIRWENAAGKILTVYKSLRC